MVSGLRKRGFQVSDIECEEPFFVTRCRSGEDQYEVLSYIYTPDKKDPVWVVECLPTIGFLGKLFGKSEDTQIAPVLNAVDETLRNYPHVREMRWFADLPSEPFSVDSYETSPSTKT